MGLARVQECWQFVFSRAIKSLKNSDEQTNRLAGEKSNKGRDVKEVDLPVSIEICLGLGSAVGKDGNEG